MRLDRQQPEQQPGKDRPLRRDGQSADEESGGQGAVLTEDGVDEYGRTHTDGRFGKRAHFQRPHRQPQAEDGAEGPDQISQKDRQQRQRRAEDQDAGRVAPFLVGKIGREHPPQGRAIRVDVEQPGDMAVERHTPAGPKIGEIPVGQPVAEFRKTVLVEGPQGQGGSAGRPKSRCTAQGPRNGDRIDCGQSDRPVSSCCFPRPWQP